MSTAVAGEPEVWDSKWKAIGTGSNAKIFTRGRPRTPHEFNHLCYYHDLSIATLLTGSAPKFCEFGAGRGTTAQYLTRDGIDVTMVDLSKAGFDIAHSNFATEGMLAPTCVLADVTRTPFDDATFHCVYSIGLLEHFDDPQDVLR